VGRTIHADNGGERNLREVSEMVEALLATGLLGSPGFLPFPLFWIALIIGAWFLLRRRDDPGRKQSAEEILSERYARGEITVEEYRQRRDELRDGR
jgi:putative membrane protein